MNIFVIASNNYPSYSAPQKGTFVYKLIQEFSKHHKVYVFAPEKRFFSKTNQIRKYGVEKATVFRPEFISLSNKNIFGFNTYHIGRLSQIKQINKIFKSIDHIDVVYAHFLSNALIAQEALGEFKVPIFAAVGEFKNIEIIKNYYKPSAYYNLIHQLKGFIAVSPQIQEKLVVLNIANSHNCIIAPNGVNRSIFKPTADKEPLRKELNLPLNKKLILFVGRFHPDKGPKRLLEAVELLNDPNYKLVLLGVGSLELKSSYLHFKGAVNNEDVAKYMAAADVFVLPTLHEGSSNVIVEAMASGLPILSSAIPEIIVQCHPDFSILIDPLNNTQIAEGLHTILSDPSKQIQMSNAARAYSKRYSIQNRAQNILKFITDNL